MQLGNARRVWVTAGDKIVMPVCASRTRFGSIAGRHTTERSARGFTQGRPFVRPDIRLNVAAAPNPVSEGKPESLDGHLRDNLPLALVLGTAAFRSYKAPAGVQPFRDWSWPNDTVITYTDKEYLAARYSYVLEVKLHSASKVPRSKSLGADALDLVPDAYVKLSLGGKDGRQPWVVKSSVKNNTTDPQWNETFYLCGRAQDLESIKLELYDEDPKLIDSDDFLGEAQVLDAKALTAGAPAKDFTVSLTKGGKPVPGTSVKLSARVASFSEMSRYSGDVTPMRAESSLPKAWLEYLKSCVGLPDDQYKELEILGSKYTAVLEIQVQDASGLPATDANGKADPLVTVAVESGGETWSKSTAVKQATLSPEWNETFTLRLRDVNTDVVRLKVFDEDQFLMFKWNEAMGEAVLDLDELDVDDTAAQDFELDLKLPNAQKNQQAARGKLRVRARLIGPQAFSQAEDDVLASSLSKSPLGDLTPVAYIDCTASDTQAWIFCSDDAVKGGPQAAEKVAVLAFRGTESSQLKDVVTDLRLIPTRLDEEKVAGNLTESLGVTSGNRKMNVHKGFRLAHDSVWDNTLAVLKTVTGAGPAANWHVYVTGHSLGGALATLGAYKLAKSGVVKKVSMYSYGQPRVGNKAFADEFNALISNAWRFANENDAVPRVPRLMGYCHVGKPVQLKDGALPRIYNPETPIEGKWMFELGKDVASSAVDGQLKSTVGAIDSQRKDFWQDLFSGRGVSQHMENFYVTFLEQACRDAASIAEAGAHPSGNSGSNN
ncbi:hypothetical protein GPECTOR_52g72 [Gonium pectorale]|uniref:C2 domain-containing protein n=1 Tax=Gonium pectorale TaxID=33097 RepID=A0A150G7Z9_GONPE|nr:hypothetical protein GPECTOR_52g72 [Gonium pectorale]|eukprot:KXZ45675.1 hypothetical protein GPECTOR_52g72 [Gonium pectorale]